MKEIKYTPKAFKDLEKIPANESKRIKAKVLQYARDPSSLANNVIRMQNECGFRLRVGNWRVRFDEDDRIIEIFRVLPRGQVYKKK